MGLYTNYINSKNPALFWEMQETSGTQGFDSSGNGYTGTYDGAVELAQAGFVDTYAVRFNPSGERLRNYAFPTDVFHVGGQGTMECWFKLESHPGSWGRIMFAGTDTTANGMLGILEYSGSGNYGISRNGCDTDTGDAFDSNWHHLCLTRNGGTARMYLDGVEAGSSSCVPTGTITDRFTVGAGNSGEYVTGLWSHAAVYNRLLTPAEIIEHYEVGAGLKAFYQVSGYVRAGGAPARRQLHIINRATGELMGTGYSDVVTGAYAIDVNTNDECAVVILEDPAVNQFEGRIRDHVIPEDKPI